jgi:hypothetical protein
VIALVGRHPQHVLLLTSTRLYLTYVRVLLYLMVPGSPISTTLAFAMQRSRLLLTFGHAPGTLNVRDSRCDIPPFQRARGRISPNPVEFSGSMPCLSELHRVLAGTLQLGLDRSLRPSTRRTYRTGVGAWIRFCARFNIPANLFTGVYPKAEVRRVTAYFVAYLRAGHGDSLSGDADPPLGQLKGSTIDQYVSRVVRYIFEREYVDDASSYFRTARTAAIILGYTNDDRRAAPCKIPFSA